jgi:hypothetical protein
MISLGSSALDLGSATASAALNGLLNTIGTLLFG